MLYNFFIHYHKNSLNSADESSHQSDYNYLADLNDEQFQIDKLMSSLVNKLATAVLRADEQLCRVKNDDSETESLIRMLFLQAITQSKIRLTADNLESFFENKFLSETR